MSVDSVHRKDSWDKAGVVAKFLIPVSVVVIGFFVKDALKEREIRAEYVKLAIDALASPSSDDASRQVKKWAFNVLREMSPVTIPPEIEAGAFGIELQRAGFRSVDGFGPGSGFLDVQADAEDVEFFVYVDGRLRATTPISFSLRDGRHAIELRETNGRSVGTTDVNITETHVATITFCQGDKMLLVGQVTGGRISVRPTCPGKK